MKSAEKSSITLDTSYLACIFLYALFLYPRAKLFFQYGYNINILSHDSFVFDKIGIIKSVCPYFSMNTIRLYKSNFANSYQQRYFKCTRLIYLFTTQTFGWQKVSISPNRKFCNIYLCPVLLSSCII